MDAKQVMLSVQVIVYEQHSVSFCRSSLWLMNMLVRTSVWCLVVPLYIHAFQFL